MNDGLPRHPICLVTDRRRLRVESGSEPSRLAALVDLVGAAAAAGVDLIQIRERDLEARVLCDVTVRCVRATERTRARVVVNDRLDVALAAGAAGVHLPAASLRAPDARRLAPGGFLVGRSVHSDREALDAHAAGGLDYLVFGTVYPSASKAPGQSAAGTAELERLARLVPLPILAIGGITVDRFEAVVRAGAAGVAAIGLFLPAGQAGVDAERLAAIVGRARRAFDTFDAIP